MNSVFKLINGFSHLVRDKVTLELKLLQSRKVINARERIYLGEGPDKPLELRTRSSSETDIHDITLNNQKVELWELIWFESKLTFVIRFVQEN